MVQVISTVMINTLMIIITNNGPGPHFVVMEYLEHGDLTSFLASHLPEDTPFLLPATRTLSFPTLVYMAAQVKLKVIFTFLTDNMSSRWPLG